MKPQNLISIALLLALPTFGFAQTHTISGALRDAASGESLIGATVYSPTLETGTTTNTYGFYSLTAPACDSITLIFNYLGYETQVKKVYFYQNYKLDIALQSGRLTLKEVEITDRKANDDNVQRPQMGVIDIPVRLVPKNHAVLRCCCTEVDGIAFMAAKWSQSTA